MSHYGAGPTRSPTGSPQNAYPTPPHSSASAEFVQPATLAVSGLSMESSETPIPPEHLQIFEDFEAYPFSDDTEFRSGLPTVIQAIKGRDRSAAQIDEMIGRAQWFYFTRMRGVNIPWDAYLVHSQRSTRATYSPRAPVVCPSSPRSRGRTSPREALAQLNNLAEAHRLVAADDPFQTSDNMSFQTLARLIAEGRAGEVAVQTIPEALNSQPESSSSLQPRPKPWETSFPTPPTCIPTPAPPLVMTDLPDIASTPFESLLSPTTLHNLNISPFDHLINLNPAGEAGMMSFSEGTFDASGTSREGSWTGTEDVSMDEVR